MRRGNREAGLAQEEAEERAQPQERGLCQTHQIHALSTPKPVHLSELMCKLG